MKALLMSMTLGMGFVAFAAHADTPAGAPAGSTGLCKDGTYSSAASKRGACRGHQGVKEWFAGAAAQTPAAADEATPARKSKKKDKNAAPATATTAAPAATPAAAPAGSTGLCKDGTYATSNNKRGACRGHKGVKEWYAAAAAAPAATSAPAPSAAPTPRAAPAAPAPTPAATRAHTPPNPATRTVAPGGGTGQVWVNEETKVYHCQGDEWYGKTKKGQYMSEAAATAAGDHPAHGKACSAQ